MAKVKFEIEVGDGEVPTAVDMLKDLIEAFDFPEYKIGVDRGVDELPPVELAPEDRAFLEALCGTACDDDPEDCAAFPYPSTGDLVEINGYELIVFSSDMAGELVLIPRDELTEEEV